MLIPIAAVVIGSSRRKTMKEHVGDLVASIARIGLQTPITVLPQNADGKYPLVAGLHRLKACSQLGHAEIEARIIEDKIDAEMWEISENLHRAELTAIQRSLYIGRWVKLTAKKISLDQKDKSAQRGPISTNETNPRGSGRKAGGVNAAARELGITRQTAQRSVDIAEHLTQAAQREAEKLGLANNQKALHRAAGVPGAEEQIRALHRVVDAQKARNKQKAQIAENHARAAAPKTGKDIFDHWLGSLDIERRAVVRIWLLGVDLEAHFIELDRAEELIRSDRRELH
jgi:ParB-like chromosome segregation protein Spo0J